MISIGKLKLGKRLNINDLQFIEKKTNVILGPNGAGKSSLLEVISKNIESFSGEVSIGPKSLRNISLSEHSQLMAYIPQKLDWNMGLKVQDIILFGLYPFGHNTMMTSDDKERFKFLVEALDLSSFLNRPFGELSGGEQKRVAIACALFQNTKIIVMDEPFAALDPFYKQMVADVLKKWQSDHEVTMILSIHDIYIAMYIGEYFFGMKSGKLIHKTEELEQSFFEKLYDTQFSAFKFDKEVVFLPRLERAHDK